MFGKSIPKLKLGGCGRRRSVFNGRSGCRLGHAFVLITTVVVLRATITTASGRLAGIAVAATRFATAATTGLAAGALRLAAATRFAAAATSVTAAALTRFAAATFTRFTAAALTRLAAIATATPIEQSGARVLSHEHNAHRCHTNQT